MAVISDELTVTVGTAGQVSLSLTAEITTTPASPAGVFEVRAIWQWYNSGTTSWDDLGTETASDPDATVYFDGAYIVDAGALSVTATKTSLTPGSSQKFRARARNASGTRSMYFSGTAGAQG